MSRLRELLRDPYRSSLVTIVVLGLAGLVAIGLGAAGIADATTLDAQLPFVVSGGIGGIALVVVAVGLHAAQRRRLEGARRRDQVDAVLQAATAVLAEARAR